MSEGGFQRGYFEKQLCICVSKSMSTVSEEEHTPVSYVLFLRCLYRVLFLANFRFRYVLSSRPGCYVNAFLKLTGKSFISLVCYHLEKNSGKVSVICIENYLTPCYRYLKSHHKSADCH